MKPILIHIPNSIDDAAMELAATIGRPLDSLQRDQFLRAWCSLAYLHPELHPDGFDDPDSGWPVALLPLATEAWRRNGAGELSADELYPSDAQWCGLFDRMEKHTPEEKAHREQLARAEMA